MTTFWIILGIVAAIGAVIAGVVLKIKSLEKENKSLTEENSLLYKRNDGLEKKVEQMNRERAAAGNHMSRLIRTEEESKVLHRKIDKAHTDEEIMDILDYIDNDNNRVVKG